MKHFIAKINQFINNFIYLIAALVAISFSMHQTILSDSTEGGKCKDAQSVPGVTDSCKSCYQTLGVGTRGIFEIFGHCDLEKGLGYTRGAGTTCQSNLVKGTLVCRTKMFESGEYFKCVPKKDQGNAWKCLGIMSVNVLACGVELAGGPGAWMLCAGQTLVIMADPCGPCALFPCERVVLRPTHQINVVENSGECPIPLG